MKFKTAKNISIYLESVTLFAKYATRKKEFKLILFVLRHQMTNLHGLIR